MMLGCITFILFYTISTQHESVLRGFKPTTIEYLPSYSSPFIT